jgi:hypothetical protein
MISPELLYQMWKYESDERLRDAARRRAAREAERSLEAEGSTSTHRNWLTVLGDDVLRLRGLWKHSRPMQPSVAELNKCQSAEC